MNLEYSNTRNDTTFAYTSSYCRGIIGTAAGNVRGSWFVNVRTGKFISFCIMLQCFRHS